MRKQTKSVAVASAAALPAIGASMTSFAATGRVEENGSRVTDESGWETATYYLGNWDEGWMKTGWREFMFTTTKKMKIWIIDSTSNLTDRRERGSILMSGP